MLSLSQLLPLGTPFTEQDILFYLAVGVLIIGALAGVQALIERFATHRKHRALGRLVLGLLFVTQTSILVAIANSGATIKLDGFNLYLGCSFLLSFIGFLLMYDAVRSLIGYSTHRKLLIAWACSLGLFFLLYFGLGDGLPMRAIWNLPAILFAFFPIHAMLFVLSFKWVSDGTYPLLRWGAGLMALASFFFIARDIDYVAKLLVYPSHFWVIVYFSESFLLLLQLLGIFFLSAESILIHRHYKKQL